MFGRGGIAGRISEHARTPEIRPARQYLQFVADDLEVGTFEKVEIESSFGPDLVAVGGFVDEDVA